jgi:hypothetical protein
MSDIRARIAIRYSQTRFAASGEGMRLAMAHNVIQLKPAPGLVGKNARKEAEKLHEP